MNGSTRSVAFAGGGTAGHVFPSIAVARALTRLDPSIEPVFIGTQQRLEGRLVPQAGYRLHHIDVLPVPRRPSFKILKLPGAIRAAVRRCGELLEHEEAVAVVTFGGYVSFPVARAAHRLQLPLIVHEQNSVPGLANRVAARWADRIAVSFPSSGDRFSHPERVAVTGNPVRDEILQLDEDTARAHGLERFELEGDRRTLLVFGGSQGARSINDAATASFGRWRNPDRLQILHVAGRALHAEAVTAWADARTRWSGPLVRCVDFVDDMGLAYATADVVVCRAGATSIAELTVLGKPSLLVPYPHATGDHQRHNAEALVRAGAARMILDGDLNGDRLARAVEPLLDDPELRSEVAGAARMFGRPDAADNVARQVLAVMSVKAPPGAAAGHPVAAEPPAQPSRPSR
ncbi:MAG: undecaprenyldiphospho-muramoylpentapeptide beta-N-acetylglucosaminyltransferase [Actinomycetota bacterium]|nr:undecaprenyldiphospho-muramoylpentapeptide beta-N-acetylglucosaminyltransferase [Actinomycetota bacterium]